MKTAMKRDDLINAVLVYLSQKNLFTKAQALSVEENRIFFNSLDNVFSYVKWLITRATKIDPALLLELSDLPNSERWDDVMYDRLISVQRKKIPGLIEPIVRRTFDIINNCKSDNYTVLCIGSGPMEIERQVILRLQHFGYAGKVSFVSLDISSAAKEFATKNLAGIINDQYQVEFIQGDALSLPYEITQKKFDLVIHSLFRHHILPLQKNDLDASLSRLHALTLEYDGYRSIPNLIPQSILAWSNPVFLNAAIFSNLRFSPKSEVLKRATDLKAKLALYNTGYYLIEYIT